MQMWCDGRGGGGHIAGAFAHGITNNGAGACTCTDVADDDLDAFIYIHFISLEFSSADLRILNEILRFIIYFNNLNFF